jgi:hypothetical protein
MAAGSDMRNLLEAKPKAGGVAVLGALGTIRLESLVVELPVFISGESMN